MKFYVTFALVCVCHTSLCDDVNESTAMSLMHLVNRTSKGFEADKSWISFAKAKEIAEPFARAGISDLVKAVLQSVGHVISNFSVTPECSANVMRIIVAIQREEFWAYQMIDASGKFTHGILDGTFTSLGDFDECLNIEVPANFQGKYCIMEIDPAFTANKTFFGNPLAGYGNSSHRNTLFTGFRHRANHVNSRIIFRNALCIPSTCSKKDVEIVVGQIMQVANIKWKVHVSHCESNSRVTLDNYQIVSISCLGFMALLVAVGTLVDIYTRICRPPEDVIGLPVQMFICFSAYTNSLRLLNIDEPTNAVKVFYGMKVITMMWVVLNHTYLLFTPKIFGSSFNVNNMRKELAFEVVLNGFLNVETFFFMSGVLAIYLRMCSSNEDFNAMLYVLRRLWRMTPPFMFLIGIMFVVETFGSGPFWSTVVGSRANDCRKNWWTNLLYINNFVDGSEMCLGWLWYVPVDMHLHILGLVVLIPIKKRPRVGIVTMFIFFLLSIVAIVVNHTANGLRPTAINPAQLEPSEIFPYLNFSYYPTYLHAVTYFSGMATGYILYTSPKLRMPKALNLFGWAISVILATSVLYGVHQWNQGVSPSLALATIYATASKVAWSLALGWVTLCCSTGNGGIVNTFLSWNGFVLFSRLTYSTFLIHAVLQILDIGHSRVMLRADHHTMVMKFLSYLVASYASAFVFSLLFESPFLSIEKLWLYRNKTENSNVSPRRRFEELWPEGTHVSKEHKQQYPSG